MNWGDIRRCEWDELRGVSEDEGVSEDVSGMNWVVSEDVSGMISDELRKVLEGETGNAYR